MRFIDWSSDVCSSDLPVKISDIPAFYSHAVFTPDGARILAVRSPAAARQHSSFEFGTVRAADLVAFPAAGGAARVVTSGTLGQRPHFVVGEPDTAYLMSDAGLIAVDLASGDRRPVATVKAQGYYFTEKPVPVDDMRLSPDGRWIAAQTSEQLYLLPLPADPIG